MERREFEVGMLAAARTTIAGEGGGEGGGLRRAQQGRRATPSSGREHMQGREAKDEQGQRRRLRIETKKKTVAMIAGSDGGRRSGIAVDGSSGGEILIEREMSC